MWKKSIVGFDVGIVLPHLLHMPTGGDREVSLLCKRFIRDGYRIAVFYLRNPEKELLKMLDDEDLKEYMFKRPKIYNLYYSVVTSRAGFYIILPIIRRIMGIDFRERYEGASVFFEKSVGDNIRIENLIAQSWEASYFVDKHRNSIHKYYRVHHNLDDPTFSGGLSRLALKSFALPLKKIVQNDHVERRFIQENPIRIHVGIETSDFVCSVPPNSRENSILFPIRTNDSKGAKYAIEAIKILHREMPETKIYGFGNYSKNKVPDYVEFLGIVSYKNLIALYNKNAVTVIPSVVEGTSSPALEAMSCGSALVSSDNEGVSSFATHDLDAIIVPVRDSIALANGAMELLNNNEKRISIALNGIKTAQKHSYERTYLELKKVIFG